MTDLNLPKELLDHDNTLKLLTILFPCSIKKILPTECIEARELLLSTFRENCAKKREDFFSDPLVKYLWNNIFIQEQPEIFQSHLRWILSDSKYGEIAIAKFVMCLRKLEACLAKFTPDGSLVEINSIKKFEQAEMHDYLVKNGKFNKKNRTQIKNQIKNLKQNLEKTIKI